MSPTKTRECRIVKLTAAQEADLAHTIDKWLKIGHCVAPLDRDRAARAVTAMYAAIGKPAPIVLVFSSPMMCLLAYGALRTLIKQEIPQLRSQLWSQLGSQLESQLESQLGSQLESQLQSQLGSQLESQLWSQLGSQLWSQLGSQLRSQLESQLWSQLGSQLWSQLESQLQSQLGSQLGSQLRSQLRSQLWSQLGSQLWSQLGSQLRSQLRSQLQSQLESQLGNYFGGQHWCTWEVFYDFCNRIGVQYAPQERALLDLWIAQSETCHWWFPYDGIVFLSERHNRCFKDSRGRLHSEDGLAVGYPDGWGVYAWHGVMVPEDLILHPEQITVDRIDKEENAEVRRVMVERMGYERYILESGAQMIHSDETGALYRKELPGDEPLVVVHVVNSTAEPDGSLKRYALRVPPDMTTARQAVAWTFGMSAEEYAPWIET